MNSLRLRFCAFVLLGSMTASIHPCYASDWEEDDHDKEIQATTDSGEHTAPFTNAQPADALTDESAANSVSSQSSTGTDDQEGGLLSELTAIERKVFGKSFEQSPLLDRLTDLEQATMNGGQNVGAKSVEQRIEALSNATADQPSVTSDNASNNQPKTAKNNWFLNPPPMPMVDSLGRGLRNVGHGIRSAGEGTQKVLTSPMFWGATAAAGAVVGGYFIIKAVNKNNNRVSYGDPYADPNAPYLYPNPNGPLYSTPPSPGATGYGAPPLMSTSTSSLHSLGGFTNPNQHMTRSTITKNGVFRQAHWQTNPNVSGDLKARKSGESSARTCAA